MRLIFVAAHFEGGDTDSSFRCLLTADIKELQHLKTNGPGMKMNRLGGKDKI